MIEVAWPLLFACIIVGESQSISEADKVKMMTVLLEVGGPTVALFSLAVLKSTLQSVAKVHVEFLTILEVDISKVSRDILRIQHSTQDPFTSDALGYLIQLLAFHPSPPSSCLRSRKMAFAGYERRNLRC